MRSLVLAWLVLVLAIGCRTQTGRVHKPGDEWLKAIEIEGSKALDEDKVLPGLALHRTLLGGRALDPYQLTVDTERIRAAYLRLGFFEVEVVARVETKATKGWLEQTVIFKVTEGRRSTTQVEIRGLPPEVAPKQARSVVALRDGAPFNYETYELSKQPLLTLIADAGYPHVQLNAAVLADRAKGVATARYEVVPGILATFGEIEISGVDGDLAEAIRGRLQFRTGEPFSASAVARSITALYDLQRFSTVRIDPDRDEGAVVPIKISVALGKLRELRYGFGFGYDPITVEARGRLGLTVIPRTNPLWRIASDFRPAFAVTHGIEDPRIKLRAVTSAQRIELFAPYIRGELEGSADYLTLEAYRTYGPRFRAGISAPLGVKWLLGRVGWLFEYLVFDEIYVTDPADVSALNLDKNQRRGAFEVSLEADLTDNRLNPHAGMLASFRGSQGTAIAGGEQTYSQVTPELRFYVPIGENVVFAMRGRLGLLFGDVPVTERYYSGGANNQRGFPDRRLSPTALGVAPDGDPGFIVIGGTAMLETGVELRIPLGELLFPIGMQLFLDGADVVRDRGDLDAFNLHWATGVGLYWQPFGLKVRLDAGYRLNRTGPDDRSRDSTFDSNLLVHFGVGETY